MKINKWSIGYALALTGLTTYLLLDAFVIPNVYQKNVSLTESSQIQSMSDPEKIMDSEQTSTRSVIYESIRLFSKNLSPISTIFS